VSEPSLANLNFRGATVNLRASWLEPHRIKQPGLNAVYDLLTDTEYGGCVGREGSYLIR